MPKFEYKPPNVINSPTIKSEKFEPLPMKCGPTTYNVKNISLNNFFKSHYFNWGHYAKMHSPKIIPKVTLSPLHFDENTTYKKEFN